MQNTSLKEQNKNKSKSMEALSFQVHAMYSGFSIQYTTHNLTFSMLFIALLRNKMQECSLHNLPGFVDFNQLDLNQLLFFFLNH